MVHLTGQGFPVSSEPQFINHSDEKSNLENVQQDIQDLWD